MKLLLLRIEFKRWLLELWNVHRRSRLQLIWERCREVAMICGERRRELLNSRLTVEMRERRSLEIKIRVIGSTEVRE